MKLFQNVPDQRSDIAFAVAMGRVGDYGLRAAITRLVVVIAMGAAVVVFDPDPLSLVVIGVAAIASYTSATDNFSLGVARTPREPLARFSSIVNQRTLGKNIPNVPGILEMLVYVPLACVGPWMITDAPDAVRVLCFAAALGYVCSCVCAVFVDPAFYNPLITAPAVEERVRGMAGPITSLGAVLVLVLSPLDTQAYWVALGLCAAPLLIQLRIKETDRVLAGSRQWASNEQLQGRRAVTAALHRDLGPSMAALYLTMDGARHLNPGLWDLTRTAMGAYRLVLGLDLAADVDTDWPGALVMHLRMLQGIYGTRFDLFTTDHPLSAPDRVLATLVLDDLTNNAAKANALECRVELVYDVEHRRFHASVIDDGDEIWSNSTWLQEGSGSFRLRKRLIDTGHGDLTLETLPDGRKLATAVWNATPSGDF